MSENIKFKKERKFSYIAVIALFLVSCMFIATIISLRAEAKEQERYIAELESEYTSQLAENEALSELIEMGDEAEYIERIAREKYGYAMPEERVYYDSAAVS